MGAATRLSVAAEAPSAAGAVPAAIEPTDAPSEKQSLVP